MRTYVRDPLYFKLYVRGHPSHLWFKTDAVLGRVTAVRHSIKRSGEIPHCVPSRLMDTMHSVNVMIIW